jgi:hypothetical protein
VYSTNAFTRQYTATLRELQVNTKFESLRNYIEHQPSVMTTLVIWGFLGPAGVVFLEAITKLSTQNLSTITPRHALNILSSLSATEVTKLHRVLSGMWLNSEMDSQGYWTKIEEIFEPLLEPLTECLTKQSFGPVFVGQKRLSCEYIRPKPLDFDAVYEPGADLVLVTDGLLADPDMSSAYKIRKQAQLQRIVEIDVEAEIAAGKRGFKVTKDNRTIIGRRVDSEEDVLDSDCGETKNFGEQDHEIEESEKSENEFNNHSEDDGEEDGLGDEDGEEYAEADGDEDGEEDGEDDFEEDRQTYKKSSSKKEAEEDGEEEGEEKSEGEEGSERSSHESGEEYDEKESEHDEDCSENSHNEDSN